MPQPEKFQGKKSFGAIKILQITGITRKEKTPGVGTAGVSGKSGQTGLNGVFPIFFTGIALIRVRTTGAIHLSSPQPRSTQIQGILRDGVKALPSPPANWLSFVSSERRKHGKTTNQELPVVSTCSPPQFLPPGTGSPGRFKSLWEWEEPGKPKGVWGVVFLHRRGTWSTKIPGKGSATAPSGAWIQNWVSVFSPWNLQPAHPK